MIEVTPRAIDEASNRVRAMWLETRLPAKEYSEPEGLCTWLRRKAESALICGEQLPSGKWRYGGLKLSIIPCCRSNGQNFVESHILQSVERVS